MAKAQEAQVLSQVLMAPVQALATGLKDPNWARTIENADMNQLLQMSFESAKACAACTQSRTAGPRRESDRHRPGLASRLNAGGVERRVTEYQPERNEPLPNLSVANAMQPEEWEE
jgi:hypothetical protein